MPPTAPTSIPMGGYADSTASSSSQSPSQSTLDDSSSSLAGSADGSTKTAQRWSDKEEETLIQTWKDNFTRLESRHARVVWEEIAKAVGKSISQCKRKIQYLKDKYKAAKDHNRNQTGGERKTSTFYDDIDSVLGCRDVVTLKHVEETGPSCSKDNETKNQGKIASSGSKEKGAKSKQRKDPASASASSGTPSTLSNSAEESGDDEDVEKQDDSDTSSIFNFLKSTSKVRKDRKKPTKKSAKSARRSVKMDGKEEEDMYAEQMKSLQNQGDKLNNILESMEKNQSQQLQIMNQFMNTMDRPIA